MKIALTSVHVDDPAAAVFGLLYLLSAEFRSETNRALGILGRGDIAGLRDYIVSFGLWAPVASCFLMVLQALVAPVPSFLITFANGLAFGVFWGWMLSLFGHVLAAAVCFGISRALGRVPVEVLVGKTGLESADRWFARWGVYAVFAGRLLPGIAFEHPVADEAVADARKHRWEPGRNQLRTGLMESWPPSSTCSANSLGSDVRKGCHTDERKGCE